jgi:hypothetical protein
MQLQQTRNYTFAQYTDWFYKQMAQVAESRKGREDMSLVDKP